MDDAHSHLSRLLIVPKCVDAAASWKTVTVCSDLGRISSTSLWGIRRKHFQGVEVNLMCTVLEVPVSAMDLFCHVKGLTLHFQFSEVSRLSKILQMLFKQCFRVAVLSRPLLVLHLRFVFHFLAFLRLDWPFCAEKLGT